MKSPIIDHQEAEDIRIIVQKIIRGLGNPDPPLRLEDVRELLDLDRQFYTSTDKGMLREVISRMYVAGKQIIKRPTILFDAIRKAKISALWIPDQRRILIDSSQPKLKHRWREVHEVSHGIIPWHDELLFGDTEISLRPTCHARLEAEANYATGQLLFLQQQFVSEANDCGVSIDSIKRLAERYNNTITSTLWRFVEESHHNKLLVGVVSRHPHKAAKEPDEKPCRYFIQSPGFRRQFSNITEPRILTKLDSYCRWYQRGGTIGEDEVVLTDDNGINHVFQFESFFNSHEVLTLATYKRKQRMTA